jgi:hypothetical protein
MKYRYIPILRWKQGEKRALKLVSKPLAEDVWPLIVVSEDTFADRPETITREAVSASFDFADDVYKHWGDRPFFFDASEIPPSDKGTHPLIDTAAECKKIGAKLTPATTLDAHESYEAAVVSVAHDYSCGVALNVSLREFTSASDWAPSWPHALDQTDLIVDLADKVATVSDLGSILEMGFRNLHRGKEWRSVTIAGTSMPANFSEYEKDDVHFIDRMEYTLWQQLIASSQPYRLDYGDYATVAITPPPSDIGWGFPINVRYTLPTQFLICRGVRTRGKGAKDMDKQLVKHANTIMKYRGRKRLDCWADETIDKIATGEDKPGGLEKWVTIAVNRHIARVRTDVP